MTTTRDHRIMRMTPEMCSAVALFHQRFAGNHRLTAQALHYEYFDNPVAGGGLYCALDAGDSVMATQGFIPHRLRRGGEQLDSLLMERALCRPDLQKTGVQISLGAAALRELCGSAPWPMLWGKTYLASPTSIGCLVDYRRPLEPGPAVAADSRHAFTPIDHDPAAAFAFLEQLYAAYPTTIFLSFTLPMLRWMVLDNPFVKFDTGTLRGPAGIEAFTVVRRAWQGMARIDELIALPGADLAGVLDALEAELRARGFTGMRFVLNELDAGTHPLAQALIARGYLARPDPTLIGMRHGARPARDILTDCAVSGLWAPPYWAPV